MTTSTSSCNQKVKEAVDNTLPGLTLALAFEVGIIDALLQSDVAVTSKDIGHVKKLKPRYVTEILNCLVCAEMVDVEKTDETIKYFIPKENRCVFQIGNIPFVGFISSAAVRFHDMISRIHQDGPCGLPYGDNPVTVSAISMFADAKLDTEITLMLDKVPGLKEKLELGIDVIEFGSGEAKLISQLAQQFPNSRFTGSDYSDFSVGRAQQTLAEKGIKNFTVKKLDILNVPDSFKFKYDFAFVNDVIHDLPDPQGGLAGLRKVLKPESFMVMIDFGTDKDVTVNKKVPGLASAYAVSSFHCVPQAYLSENSSVLGCCWGIDTAIRYSEKAGFKVLSQHPNFGFFVVFVCQAV